MILQKIFMNLKNFGSKLENREIDLAHFIRFRVPGLHNLHIKVLFFTFLANLACFHKLKFMPETCPLEVTVEAALIAVLGLVIAFFVKRTKLLSRSPPASPG